MRVTIPHRVPSNRAYPVGRGHRARRPSPPLCQRFAVTMHAPNRRSPTLATLAMGSAASAFPAPHCHEMHDANPAIDIAECSQAAVKPMEVSADGNLDPLGTCHCLPR